MPSMPSEISPEHNYYEILKSTAETSLANTAFVQPRPFTEADVASTRDFLVKAAKDANPKLMPNFWGTTMLAAVYARKLTEALPSIDFSPQEAESLNLIHDLGRLVSPDQYYRNDLLADRLQRRVGFRPEVTQNLPSINRILGMGTNPIKGIEDVSKPQRILHVADWLGKRGASGLVTVDEIVERSSKAMRKYNQDAVWPSVSAAMRALASGKEQSAEALFLHEVDWLEQSGVDLLKIRNEVEETANSVENQTWIAQAAAARL
jgi:hypothetical protein